jgi:hypothetical protein
MLKEVGIEYTFNKDTANELPFQALTYRWRNLKTGNTGIEVIYTYNNASLLELVNHWNIIGQGTWLFTR